MSRSPNAEPPPAPVASVIAKPVGPRCNLACAYCFYRDKVRLFPERADLAMSAEVLESFVRQTLADSPLPQVGFCWQGGEPTLAGLGFFREVVRLQEKYRCDKAIENALQTNGVALDDEWCDFLADHGFLVGLSIDGPEPLHDRFRTTRTGGGTFRQVMRAVERLQKHGVSYNTVTAVHSANVHHPLEVYRFLRQISEGHMQFIPIVERLAVGEADEEPRLVPPAHRGAARVAPWAVGPGPWGDFLCEIFDEWVRHDVGRCFVRIFETALEARLGMEPSLCVCAPTCGRALVLEHDGSLYSCDHYVYPENRLGNILEQPLASLIGSQAQARFGDHKRDGLPRRCGDCEVRFICNGGCPKQRFATAPDGEAGLNHLCAGYERFFRHVDPYVRFMAQALRQHRSPAGVMSWARERDHDPT